MNLLRYHAPIGLEAPVGIWNGLVIEAIAAIVLLVLWWLV